MHSQSKKVVEKTGGEAKRKKIRRWQKYFPLLEAINLFRWLERLGLTAVIVAWFRFQTKDHSGRNKEKF